MHSPGAHHRKLRSKSGLDSINVWNILGFSSRQERVSSASKTSPQNLYEFEIPLSADQASVIEQLATSWGLERERWSFIQSLVQ